MRKISKLQRLIHTLNEMKRKGLIESSVVKSMKKRAEGYIPYQLQDARGIHHSGLRVGKEMRHSVRDLSRRGRMTRSEGE